MQTCDWTFVAETGWVSADPTFRWLRSTSAIFSNACWTFEGLILFPVKFLFFSACRVRWIAKAVSSYRCWMYAWSSEEVLFLLIRPTSKESGRSHLFIPKRQAWNAWMRQKLKFTRKCLKSFTIIEAFENIIKEKVNVYILSEPTTVAMTVVPSCSFPDPWLCCYLRGRDIAHSPYRGHVQIKNKESS